MAEPQTLETWLAAAVRDGGVAPALAGVVDSLARACVALSAQLRTAPLRGLSGALDSVNVQGETQKPLDIIANGLFVDEARANPNVAAVISEEMDEALMLEPWGAGPRYALAFDPLDGSSNLDVNVTVGSIFSVLGLGEGPVGVADLLQPGNRQLAAGYAAYGPATSLVLSFGRSTASFTLDEARGVFLLVQPKLAIAPSAPEFAINTARYRFWDAPTRAYVDACLAGETGPFGQRYNMRWVGSMVADIHRIFSRGGIFLYPNDSETAAKGGRLRLMYEANPMSFLIEAAGGGASTGRGRLLDLVPTAIHQRVPVILGSREEVSRYDGFYEGA